MTVENKKIPSGGEKNFQLTIDNAKICEKFETTLELFWNNPETIQEHFKLTAKR